MRPRTVAAVVLAFLLGVAGGVVTRVGAEQDRTRAEQADERATTYAVQAKALGEQVAASDVCQSTNVDTQVQFGYLCSQARKVADQSEPDPVDTEALASLVTSIVMAGLPDRIDDAVSRYMAANPQRQAPSRDEIRAWVVAEVAKIPPPANGAPGKAGASGKDGEDGKDAPPPTDEQIDASVARWFEAHPVNDCPGVWRGPFVDESGSTIYHCEVP